jgi:hypothetical protein
MTTDGVDSELYAKPDDHTLALVRLGSHTERNH